MAEQTSDLIDLSDRLRQVMRECGMTVAELAEAAGVSKSAMEKYLAGPSSPRAQVIARLCLKTGVTADWLLLGHDDPYPHNIRTSVVGGLITMLMEIRLAESTRQIVLDEDGEGIRDLVNKAEDRIYRTIMDRVESDRRNGYQLAFGKKLPTMQRMPLPPIPADGVPPPDFDD